MYLFPKSTVKGAFLIPQEHCQGNQNSINASMLIAQMPPLPYPTKDPSCVGWCPSKYISLGVFTSIKSTLGWCPFKYIILRAGHSLFFSSVANC